MVRPRHSRPSTGTTAQATKHEVCELLGNLDSWTTELTQIRFWNSTPRIRSGLNSVGTGLPSGCGSNAVPAGGYWRGTKYGTFGAGALYEARAAMCVVCRVSWMRLGADAGALTADVDSVARLGPGHGLAGRAEGDRAREQPGHRRPAAM